MDLLFNGFVWSSNIIANVETPFIAPQLRRSLWYVFLFKKFLAYGTCDLSSPTRDQTGTPFIRKQNLNHWTTKKVLGVPSKNNFSNIQVDCSCVKPQTRRFPGIRLSSFLRVNVILSSLTYSEYTVKFLGWCPVLHLIYLICFAGLW